MNALEWLFWFFAIIVAYTYAGYGVLLWFLVSVKRLIKGKKTLSEESGYANITLLIAAYNEEEIVDVKMQNTLDLNYPQENLFIVWVTDGSTDSTNEKLKNYPQVRVLFDEARRGKTAALNRAMKFVETPLVVFTDANTLLNQEALSRIVREFDNPEVGCVAGEKRVLSKDEDTASAGGEGIYWKYESLLKKLDWELNTAIGAAGELFAVRTPLFEEVPTDTLLDDFLISMKIVAKGYKIAYCKDAYASESGSLNMSEEKKRKVRIAAGGVQAVWRLRGMANFFKFPVLAFQFISHRILRWTITPVSLFLLLPLNMVLALTESTPLYYLLLVFQLLFYMMSIVGKINEDKKIRNKIFFVPYYFIFMNMNVIRGFFYLSKKRGDGTWEKSKRNK